LKCDSGPQAFRRPDPRRIPGEKPGNPRLFGQALQKSRIGRRKPERSKPRTARNVRRYHAKALDEGGRRLNVDRAARCQNGEAPIDGRRFRGCEILEKIPLQIRFVRNDDHTCNVRDAVGVLLESRIPEILRIVLLTGGEMNFRRQYIVCKSERETNFYRQTIRTFAFALEMHLVGTGYARS